MTATCRRCHKPTRWVLSLDGTEWQPAANDGTRGCPAYRHPEHPHQWIDEWHEPTTPRPEGPR